MYYNLIKYFTDKSISEKYQGEITQSIFHIIKLEYRFNYEYDRDHHIGSILGWLVNLAIEIKSDRKCNGPASVIKRYRSIVNPMKLCNSWTALLRSNYKFEGRLTLDDFEEAITKVIDLLQYPSKSEMRYHLELMFPELSNRRKYRIITKI